MEKYSAPVLACRLGNLWHGSCSLPREKESSMAEPQVQLSVREIRKSFPGKGGDIPVLNGLNFDIYEKDFVSIIAPSGRSEVRRVGNECVSSCRSRWSPDYKKKK